MSRYFNPIERQLPFAPFWFDRDFMAHFMGLPWAERKRLLKKPRIPASSLPGMAAHAERLGVRVIHHARVQYGAELWGGVQLHYKTPEGMQVERFNHLVAATGASPKVRVWTFSGTRRVNVKRRLSLMGSDATALSWTRRDAGRICRRSTRWGRTR